jgi:2-keto-4-pentenoate hydratase/2-oxohepta-3-ene-1,7-dioic acid hydratase in catechol pathway
MRTSFVSVYIILGSVVKLISYRSGGSSNARAGVQIGGLTIDAAGAIGSGEIADGVGDWSSVRSIIEAGQQALSTLDSAVHAAVNKGVATVDPAGLQLAPPIPDPRKIVCLGLNYRDHAEEAGLEPPEAPILFAKFANSLIGSGDPILLPPFSEVIDYEAELAVVIGVRCRNVSVGDVRLVLAGATAFNDVTARDIQMQTSQWTAGKAIDSFAPCGPCLVTLDELDDLQNLSIRTRLNGTTLQDGNTQSMIFSVGEAVAFISSLMTLEPGDIIATGTPAGVGFTRTPPVLLRDGDAIEVEIDRIGVLQNPVQRQLDMPLQPSALLRNRG